MLTKFTNGILPGILSTPEYNALIEHFRQWAKAAHGRAQMIADALKVSKQLVSGWLSGYRTVSLDEWTQIQAVINKESAGAEFLEEQKNMKTTTFIDPRATPQPTASDPGRPRTLSVAIDALDEANSTISNLRSELAQLKGGAVALPVKIILPPATPGQPRAAAPTTRQGIVADRTPEQKLPEKLTLPASAITPFLADEIIKVTPTESLRRMLDSETISWRRAALYRAIKEREKLSTY